MMIHLPLWFWLLCYFTTLVLAAMLPDIDSEMEQGQTECVPLERSLSVHCLCNDVVAVKFLVVVICPVLVHVYTDP